MKNRILLNICLFFASLTYGQTIVSTTPENKNVILEIITGINCTYCPNGHNIADQIINNNPGDAFLIAIHAGSYANPSSGQPDFRTQFGNAIRAQSGAVGTPSGTVNRHVFANSCQGGGSCTAMSRGLWSSRSNMILNESSYMNMAAEATIDVTNRELEVHVEAFYTGTSPVEVNKLNIALLQNNTLGPQTSGGAGDEYNHMHRLIHLITGQWGDDIEPTSQGSFIDRTYTYTIPADHNNIPIKLVDLELVVFMAETSQEIISGNGAVPEFTGINFDNDANIASIPEIEDQCGLFKPVFELQNTGLDPLESVEISYSVNNEAPQTYTWTGSLDTWYSELVTLPAISFDIQTNNTLEIILETDENNSNNALTQSFNRIVDLNSNEVTLILNTDNQGNECTWEIMNQSGEIVASGGPYNGVNNIIETFNLIGDCYNFNLYDSGNNGGESVVLFDSNSNTIYSSPGTYGSGASVPFETEFILDLEDNYLSHLSLYPNPTNSSLNILNAENTELILYDVLGKVLLTKVMISNQEIIDLSHLMSGTYFISLNQDNQKRVEKILKL